LLCDPALRPTSHSNDHGCSVSRRKRHKRAARHLKAERKRADVTDEELANRLKEHGFAETKASITNKLARATMSAHFYLASLAAIGPDTVNVVDI
jgi:hypothetical protein